jgi:hypothetical protein
VVGDEPVVVVDWYGATTYALPRAWWSRFKLPGGW